jgi:hypothetical protein
MGIIFNDQMEKVHFFSLLKEWFYWSVFIFFSLLIPYVLLLESSRELGYGKPALVRLFDIIQAGILLGLLQWFFLRKKIAKAWLWACHQAFIFGCLASIIYIWIGMESLSLALPNWKDFAFPALSALATNLLFNSFFQFQYFWKNRTGDKDWWIPPFLANTVVVALGMVFFLSIKKLPLPFFSDRDPEFFSTATVIILILLYVVLEAAIFTSLKLPPIQGRTSAAQDYLNKKYFFRLLTWFIGLELTGFAIISCDISIVQYFSRPFIQFFNILAVSIYFCWREWHIFDGLFFNSKKWFIVEVMIFPVLFTFAFWIHRSFNIELNILNLVYPPIGCLIFGLMQFIALRKNQFHVNPSFIFYLLFSFIGFYILGYITYNLFGSDSPYDVSFFSGIFFFGFAWSIICSSFLAIFIHPKIQELNAKKSSLPLAQS